MDLTGSHSRSRDAKLERPRQLTKAGLMEPLIRRGAYVLSPFLFHNLKERIHEHWLSTAAARRSRGARAAGTVGTAGPCRLTSKLGRRLRQRSTYVKRWRTVGRLSCRSFWGMSFAVSWTLREVPYRVGAAGDRVACEMVAEVCGQCVYCLSGNYNLCPHRVGYEGAG